jgi:hypothetical protein
MIPEVANQSTLKVRISNSGKSKLAITVSTAFSYNSQTKQIPPQRQKSHYRLLPLPRFSTVRLDVEKRESRSDVEMAIRDVDMAMNTVTPRILHQRSTKANAQERVPSV